MPVNELIAVPIACINECLCLRKSARKRADEIVCFISAFFQNADIHCGKQFLEHRDLYNQRFRHRFARRFISVVHLVPESGFMYVKGDNKIAGLFIF